MSKFRNFINRTIKKYSDFKAKLVSFKNKTLDGIYKAITYVEIKIIRLKVNFNYYIEKLLESLNNIKRNISVLGTIRLINKRVRLENKLMYVKTKIRAV